MILPVRAIDMQFSGEVVDVDNNKRIVIDSYPDIVSRSLKYQLYFI